ncbi:MAG: hypothetical protein OEN01_10340 [Candidatus Krumholzibacteria bacterium]|nr:hypothetical protein [Candidatus Krumholzibacteria bacterium]
MLPWITACLIVVIINVPQAHAARHPSVLTANYRIYAEAKAISHEELETVATNCEEAYERIQDFLGRPVPSVQLTYHIYPSFEAKGLSTGNTQLRHADVDRKEIHMVINDWVRGDDATMDAFVLARHHLPVPATRALETGLVTFLSDGWRRRGYEYWAVRLYQANNALALADLLDNNAFAEQSYLIRAPLAGTFVAYLISEYGRGVLFDHYRTWRPTDESEVNRLQTGWRMYLAKLSDKYARQIRLDRASFPKAPGFQKGFCHAHEGYQIFDGYLSEKSDHALKKLADMGTNAVSITPFTFMRDPQKPVSLPFSHGPGAENDECVIHSAHEAQTLGMQVMLKPHIWLGGGQWPGDIEMPSDKDWRQFFEYYEKWLRHYALLAEMYEIELLCIGVELSRATVGHEDRWSEIIGNVRSLYSGRITYAANWGEEFENVTFWDQLDFIGINCYYPLSNLDDPTFEDLKQGMRSVLRRIEPVHDRYRKPVLITEIGYTSTARPWKKPHEAAWGRRQTNLDHQALCYKAVMESLHGQTWCQGIYWWKWPSFLEFGGPNNPGFTPNGKPAEEIVREWFGKAWPQSR